MPGLLTRATCLATLCLCLAVFTSTSAAAPTTAGISVKDVSASPEKIETFAADGSVTVKLRVRSERRGIHSVSAWFGNPRRPIPVPLTVELERRRTAKNEVWAGEMFVPRYSTLGRWRLEQLHFFDSAGRGITSFAAAGLGRRARDAAFKIVGRDDHDPPEMSAFSLSPTVLRATDPFTRLQVSMAATDALSGVGMIGIRLRGPIDLGEYGFSYSPSTEITMPAPMAARPVPGSSSLTVTVRDETGNVREYSTAELAARGFTSSLTWF